ncbi:MAG: SDR family oxidoreductase, partial [Chloroflexota bacterium]|nr:SDR family oxidoreductase [Chloroflexota bacterium]
MRLAGKTALVTGAGRGIGRAISERFAAEGAAVALVARTGSEVDDVAASIRRRGARAIPLAVDIADADQVAVAVGEIEGALGGIDVLVNNAGISEPRAFVGTPHAEWDRVVRVNLYGAIHCARAVAAAMVRRGRGGSIVNISSIHASRAEPLASSYDVAKGGLDQLTRALAVELAPQGIRVNSVAPGFIDTVMAIGPDGVNELETEWFQGVYVAGRRIPLARAGSPDEVANA